MSDCDRCGAWLDDVERGDPSGLCFDCKGVDESWPWNPWRCDACGWFTGAAHNGVEHDCSEEIPGEQTTLVAATDGGERSGKSTPGPDQFGGGE
ncbi:hypothetical protein G9C85_02560 [Halorubellus sp. JP-L1]|uniref:hypothetical protein n=1 Tax=Halorubellus sp. JP-L1 TaxID=2715753 RepID=UPI00140BAB18|nr:hypothetical protein [Halorubellus sp. JP-L1]NHN40520.1 hypothetical protein [Halorubellus sp. JP-L1]